MSKLYTKLSDRFNDLVATRQDALEFSADYIISLSGGQTNLEIIDETLRMAKDAQDSGTNIFAYESSKLGEIFFFLGNTEEDILEQAETWNEDFQE